MPMDGFRQKKQEELVQMPDHRTPDGFLFDTEGNLITSSNAHADGTGEIHTYDRKGKLIDVFKPGPSKAYTNVALADDNVLVITDSDGGNVLAVDNWPAKGLKLFPFRKK